MSEASAITRRHAQYGTPPPGEYWFPPLTLTPVETMERLLGTRWNRAEETLLRTRPADDTASPMEEMAAVAECEPQSSGIDHGVDIIKIDAYARQRAAALSVEEGPRHRYEPERSWRGPKLLLLHDQLERIAHWATEGDAAATLALLRQLHRCCEVSAEEASLDQDIPREAQTYFGMDPGEAHLSRHGDEL
uniref:Uncharacterized protein n=1 Tax=Haptolina brevifila TaxID=156173 RepID=A0A7S2J0S1_9EUKA